MSLFWHSWKCNTLLHTATHCNTLQCTAQQLICSAPHNTGLHESLWTLQHTATHYGSDESLLVYLTLQHTVPHRKTLQHTATHGHTLQHIATQHVSTRLHCSARYASACVSFGICGGLYARALQLIAQHCSTLQHTVPLLFHARGFKDANTCPWNFVYEVVSFAVRRRARV